MSARDQSHSERAIAFRQTSEGPALPFGQWSSSVVMRSHADGLLGLVVAPLRKRWAWRLTRFDFVLLVRPSISEALDACRREFGARGGRIGIIRFSGGARAECRSTDSTP